MNEIVSTILALLFAFCFIVQPIIFIIFLVKYFTKKTYKRIRNINIIVFIVGILSFVLFAVISCDHINYTETKIVAPTCTERGYTLNHCNDCGNDFENTYIDKIEHDYVQVSVIDATEEENGTITYECSICGDQETEKIDKLVKIEPSIEEKQIADKRETPAKSDIEKIDFKDGVVQYDYKYDGYNYQYFYTYDLDKYVYPDEKDVENFINSEFKEYKEDISKGCIEIFIGFGDDTDIVAYAFKDGVKELDNFVYTSEDEYNAMKEASAPKNLGIEISKYTIPETVYLIFEESIGENEEITDVTYENNTINVYMDITNVQTVDENGFAISWASTITDAILAYPELDNYWNSIKIIYKDIGYIELNKSMIVDSVYGRYMDIKDEMLIKS